ncbi:MAG: hypothetical protein WC326_05385 [Candidatus Delongbacteria bacterium]
MKHRGIGVLLGLSLLAGTGAQAREWSVPQWLRTPAYQPSRQFTLDGWLDHTSTWLSDSSYAGAFQENLNLHTTRLIVGAHGVLPAAGELRYLVRTGATLAQNTLYEQRVYTPELQGDLDWKPVHQVQLGLFSRYGWRRPNAFLVDSLRLRDLILGARLALRPLDHTELTVSAGNRRVLNERASTDHRFLRGELEQRIPAWNQFLIRGWGESSWYGLADSLDFDLQRSLAGLTLAGTMPGGAAVHSNSGLVEREGVRRLLGQNRVRWQQGPHRLSANAGADYTKQDERSIYRRQAGLAWRWMPTPVLGSELRISSDRAQVDDVDRSHRRDYLALAIFDWRPLAARAAAQTAAGVQTDWSQPIRHGLWLKRDLLLRGDLGGGWSETAEYGNGITGRGELELLLPVEPVDWLGLNLRELARGELFRLQDQETVAPHARTLQREADNLLGLGSTLLPHGSFQVGHNVDWRRHVGTELVFSDDTLRNTINNELWIKWRRNRIQARLSGMSVQHLVDEDPVKWERRVAAQLRWQPVRPATFNLRGVWRPRRDPLPERMWIRAFAEFEMNKLQLTADLRFVGDPANFGDTDTQAWIHVLRRLW